MSISLCKITQLKESEVRLNGWTLTYIIDHLKTASDGHVEDTGVDLLPVESLADDDDKEEEVATDTKDEEKRVAEDHKAKEEVVPEEQSYYHLDNVWGWKLTFYKQ